MDIVELINNPKEMDRETLYELRSQLALYPYSQTLRLLLLQNLYILHDPSFNDELRRAAIYITDRRVIFQMIEAGHYQMATLKSEEARQPQPRSRAEQDSRTLSLIDNFLMSLPQDDEEPRPKRKPTPADAAVDYVAYLLESGIGDDSDEETPQLKGQELIDSFIENDRGKRRLSETPTLRPETEEEATAGSGSAEGTADAAEGKENGDTPVYTETLSRIYIKQGRYEKALDIIRRLNASDSPSPYYADQIRFLEKLIINNNHN